MNSGKVFAAPWSGSLKLITLLSVGVLLSIPVFGMNNFYDGMEPALDLTDLESAETDPQAMKGSIRTFGNGGLFCFAGRFRNRKLGSYRVFATDPKLAVVLRFPDKVVVVTPKSPAVFSNNIRSARRTLSSGKLI